MARKARAPSLKEIARELRAAIAEAMGVIRAEAAPSTIEPGTKRTGLTRRCAHVAIQKLGRRAVRGRDRGACAAAAQGVAGRVGAQNLIVPDGPRANEKWDPS
jgi:hypothetical protein